MVTFPSRLLVSLLVWSLFIAACATPALQTSETRAAYGFEALVLGMIPPYTLTWSANLLLVAGWICLICKWTGGAVLLGISAALLGLTTLFFSVLFHPYLYDLGLREGYYLWQASLITFAVNSLTIWLREPEPNEEPVSEVTHDHSLEAVRLGSETPKENEAITASVMTIQNPRSEQLKSEQ
jgi:hypothetical protein